MSFGGGFSTAAAPAAQPSFAFPAANTTAAIKPAAFGTSAFGFSTPATQSTGFGSAPAFGAPTASAATGFGSTTTATSTFSNTGTSFGFGGTTSTFGAAPTTLTTGGFGTLAAPATSAPFNFNTFGSTAATGATQAAPLFGSTAPAFGAGSGTAFSGFGAKPATTTTASGFGGFGTGGLNFGGGFGQPQQQQQQQQQQSQQQTANAISEALYNAVFNCQIFNDERDSTIARWNLIQALWGTGRAFYSNTAPPIELNQENPLCRFKAIGYSQMPNADNNDGLVILSFNKKEQELKDGKPQLIASFHQILGNRPNLTVMIDNIKAQGETKSQVTIFVLEKGVTGSSRKIPANDLVAYFSQTVQKGQLSQMGIDNMYAQVKLEPSQLKEYLDNPPCSIDPRLWKQAQLDNPNSDLYIPVPMIGFQQVKHRLKCQEEETTRHRAFLDMAAEKIQGLQRQHTATQARLKEHRRGLLGLQHQVLKILVRQEITKKVGLSLQPEEESLSHRFEGMHSQISQPTQFKGKISEMLSQLRMRRHVDMQNQERYTMDPIAQDDIKTYLGMQQQGMSQLIDTVHSDMESLKIIKDGMSDLLSGHTIS